MLFVPEDRMTNEPKPNLSLSAPVDYEPVFSAEQIKKLEAKLSPDVVAKRDNLSYIEAHVAIRHANQIFGFGNWQRNQPVFSVVNDESYMKGDKKMYRACYTCSLSVTVFGLVNGVRTAVATTWGTGYGEGITGVNPGQAHESAIKEAESDAMKRALIALGDQFGLALYDKQQRYVGEDDSAPDTYGEKNAVVTAEDVTKEIGKLIGTKKNLAIKFANEFKTQHNAEKLDNLDGEQLKTLLKELKQFR